MLIINYYRFKQIILKGMQEAFLSMPAEMDIEEVFKSIEETLLVWSQADGIEAVKEAVSKLSELDVCWNKPALFLNNIHLSIRRIELFLNGTSCQSDSMNIAAEDLAGAKWFLNNFLKILGSSELNREMRIRTLAHFLANLRGKGELPKVDSIAELKLKTLPRLKEMTKLRDSIPKPGVFQDLITTGILSSDEIWTLLQGRGTLEISFTELKDSLPYILSSAHLLKIESLKSILLIISKNKKVSLGCLNNILHLTSGIYATLPTAKKQEFLDAFLKILATEVISLEKWSEFQEKVHQLLLKSYDLHYSEQEISNILKAYLEKNTKATTLVDALHKHFLEVEKYKLTLILLTNSDFRKRIEDCRLKLRQESAMNDAQKCYLVALCLEASRRTLSINPTPLQIFNLLAFLEDPKGRRISSQQEGPERTMTLAWLAAFKAMNFSVDMVCKNREIVSINELNFREFFAFLGLKTVVYHERLHRRDILEADILYGTLEDFEREFLEPLNDEEELLFTPICQRKSFEVVIVDDMSNLFLDSEAPQSSNSKTNPIFESETLYPHF